MGVTFIKLQQNHRINSTFDIFIYFNYIINPCKNELTTAKTSWSRDVKMVDVWQLVSHF